VCCRLVGACCTYSYTPSCPTKPPHSCPRSSLLAMPGPSAAPCLALGGGAGRQQQPAAPNHSLSSPTPPASAPALQAGAGGAAQGAEQAAAGSSVHGAAVGGGQQGAGAGAGPGAAAGGAEQAGGLAAQRAREAVGDLLVAALYLVSGRTAPAHEPGGMLNLGEATVRGVQVDVLRCGQAHSSSWWKLVARARVVLMQWEGAFRGEQPVGSSL